MADPTQSEEEFFALYQTTGIPALVELLIEVQGTAQGGGLREVAEGVGRILAGLLEDINKIAVEYAGIADEAIVRKIEETRAANRPAQGEMSTHIRSTPGPLGAVGVAMKSELDKIINPEGYGPFWRAQEYGTGTAEVPSQEGRIIYGTFDPSGEPPRAAQRGLGVGRDLAFFSGGPGAGLGRISVELPGRHFLRDGSIEAGAKYIEAMGAVQQKWVDELHALQGALRRRTGVRYTGSIEA